MIREGNRRVRFVAALVCALLSGLALQAPVRADEPEPPDPCVKRIAAYSTYDAFLAKLDGVASIADPRLRARRVEDLWQRLKRRHEIPFASGDRVAFLYRGEAETVEVRGDFNEWGETPPTFATRVAGTDLWIAEQTLPPDARVDYKFVVDGEWTMDPVNPLVAWSGFGPNSELRMPAYRYPYAAVPQDDVVKGVLTPPQRISSTFLAYDLQYQVYLPAGYEGLADLPTLYVTDGHEYSPDHMGSLVAVLDNAIANRSVAPLVVVFVDARNPDNLGENRRLTEYVANPLYLSFVTEELVPRIDATYRTRDAATARGILGTSLGGLASAYFAALRPDVFLNVGIQSPAFWIFPAIYALYERPPADGMRIYMSQGTIFDGDGGDQMKERFDRWGYTYTYVKRNEGHAWAHWRAVLTGMMRDLYPGSVASAKETARRDVCS